jgi:hypothetical protein
MPQRAKKVRTALRVGHSPSQYILVNRKAPTVLPTSETLFLDVEPLSEVRTPHGKGRVSARRGWEGENDDFFSILLGQSHNFTSAWVNPNSFPRRIFWQSRHELNTRADRRQEPCPREDSHLFNRQRKLGRAPFQ